MFSELLPVMSTLMSDPLSVRQVYFSGNQQAAPSLAYQVHFPRLELVLSGSQNMVWSDFHGKTAEHLMIGGDVLFVCAGGWNNPEWGIPVTTLSILFGKQQIGFSLLYWDGETFYNKSKENVLRRGPRVGSFLLQALTEIAWDQRAQNSARLIVRSLLSHCVDLLGSQVKTASRSKALFDAVREHLDEHYREPITRESVAQAFYISPNYLSHLFQKAGSIGFNEYLTYTRLEQSKQLLKRYDMKIKEVANSCGFVDSNYFCRLFRKATDRSPSEYRRHYRSLLENRESIEH